MILKNSNNKILVPVTLPSELSPQFWLRPETLPTTNGAVVSTWADSMGSAFNFVQTTAANQPEVKINAINGYSSVLFRNDISLKYLVSEINHGLGTNPNCTLLTVSKPLSGSLGSDPICLSIGSISPGALLFATNNTNYIGGGTGGANNTIVSRTATVFDIVNIKREGGNTTTFTHKSSGKIIKSSSVNIMDMRWGLGVATPIPESTRWCGEVVEVIFFNRTLTQAEIHKVHEYLKVKFKI